MIMVVIKQSNYTADPASLLTQLALYQISENGGLFYTVISLIPLVLYFDFFRPTVNDAEEKYLKRLAKSEVLLVLCQPILMLIALGLLSVISLILSWPPLYTIFTWAIIFGGVYFFPGFIALKLRISSVASSNLTYDIISKAARECHLVCTVSLYALICAISGPTTFNFNPSGSVYNFPSQTMLPWPNLRFVDKNGANVGVDLNRGYLTLFLHLFVPESTFFLIMFYLSHIYLATSMRCLMFYVYFLFDNFVKIYQWMLNGNSKQT